MKSLYRRSWFPGIGPKPLESIRIGCEPSPAQSRLFFASYFICVREPDLVFAHWSWAQTNRQKSKQTAIKKKQKRFQIFLWSPNPCPGIGVPRPTIGVPRPSMGVPRVVLGLSSAPCAFNMPSFFLAEILWMFLISWLKLPSACSFPRKIYIVVFLLGICGQSKGVLAYPIIIPWASILVYPGITLRPLPV